MILQIKNKHFQTRGVPIPIPTQWSQSVVEFYEDSMLKQKSISELKSVG